VCCLLLRVNGVNAAARDAAGKTAAEVAATAETRALLSRSAADVAAEEAAAARCAGISAAEREWLLRSGLLPAAAERLTTFDKFLAQEVLSAAQHAAKVSPVLGDLITRATVAVAAAEAEEAQRVAYAAAVAAESDRAAAERTAADAAAAALVAKLQKVKAALEQGVFVAAEAETAATQECTAAAPVAVELARLYSWELFDALKPRTDAAAAHAAAAVERAAAEAAAREAVRRRGEEAHTAAAAAKAVAEARAAAAARAAADAADKEAEAAMRAAAERKQREARDAVAAARREADAAAKAQMAEAERAAAHARAQQSRDKAAALEASAAAAAAAAAAFSAQLEQKTHENAALAAKLDAAQRAAAAAAAAAAPAGGPSGKLPSTRLLRPPGPKHALCIGCSAYAPPHALANPVRDARAIAAKLSSQDVGFTSVDVVTDPDVDAFELAVGRFCRKLTAGAVGLFFFAGHGTAAPDGTNYMLPISANLADERPETLPAVAMSLQMVLNRMKERDCFLNILIADACRSLPVARSGAGGRAIKAVGGFSRMEAPSGSMIAFACAQHAEARDGPPEGNGVFTTALLAHIATPVHVDTMLIRVTNDVMKATDNAQEPFHTHSLRQENVCLF
jgi:hypothetical protein